MSAGKGDSPRPYSREAWDKCPLWDKFGKKPKLRDFKGNADKPVKKNAKHIHPETTPKDHE